MLSKTKKIKVLCLLIFVGLAIFGLSSSNRFVYSLLRQAPDLSPLTQARRAKQLVRLAILRTRAAGSFPSKMRLPVIRPGRLIKSLCDIKRLILRAVAGVFR